MPVDRCRGQALANRLRLDPVLEEQADKDAGVLDCVLKLGAAALSVGVEDLNRIAGFNIEADGDVKPVLCTVRLPGQATRNRRPSMGGADPLGHNEDPL